jgi:hypothetical protein
MASFGADGREVRRLDVAAGPWPFPGGADAASPNHDGLLPLDWNHDFRRDLFLAGAGGVRLLLQQPDGAFTDATAAASPNAAIAATPASGAWAVDVEMDGDLDVLVGNIEGDPLVLRNNGNGTWMPTRPFTAVDGVSAFAWGDLDTDGDPDAALVDGAGTLHVFANQQAGAFERRAPPPVRNVAALAMGDANADGTLDLVTLATDGGLQRASMREGVWQATALAQWSEAEVRGAGSHWLTLADLDNNGALDLLASGPSANAIWLADERLSFQRLPVAPPGRIFSVADLDDDGRLDLLALAEGRPVLLRGQGARDYHWQVIRPRAQTAAGDQRINAFGAGGEIEVRSGLLMLKQVLTGMPIHVGLGTRAAVDLARIVWPNGVMQVEFDVQADRAVVAEQRLKGSCPWLFTWDGRQMQFVTDFLWRSPLGLRINAQDTAGIAQTEDWVKVRGDQLVARDGVYDVRITAELWETHFFDFVSLMAVDHPPDVEVFVDERFATRPPKLAVRPLTPPRPVARAWDDRGGDVTPLVQARDGRHVAGFDKGRYQGVTQDHAIEFELGGDAPREGALWLIASGWVYPTDSSINVAIGQGGHDAPRGLALEALEGGVWRTIHADLGFPAGKTKTMLVDLVDAPRHARFRLRTNMEIYWDSLAYAAVASEDGLRTTRLAPVRAELRYRGFSRTSQDVRAHAPEVPDYHRIANTAPRWRDLVGYHTRFGDVRPLLNGVDDRYVIVNAGDELRLEFAELPAPPPGWRRDFVFIGDGWEKDGDFNTGYSKTVEPLPTHNRTEYRAPEPFTLEHDPVYRAHPNDWRDFHTRFVSPDRYLRGLRP